MIYFYMISIVILLFISTTCLIRNKTKAEILFMLSSFLIVYLVCILRAPSVGRDILGYKHIYELTEKIRFSNFDYVYFENGYILMMKISIIFGLSFQKFLIICYLIMLLPIWVFIYRYSNNKLLSIILFICYMFFEIYLTALRQSISMSIFLIALMILLSKRRGSVLIYYLIILLASFVHRGVLVCIFIPILFLVHNKNKFVMTLLPLYSLLVMFRGQLMTMLLNFFGREMMDSFSMYFGFNSFVLLMIFLVLIVYEQMFKINYKFSENIFILMLIMGLLIGVYFGTNSTARSYMYYVFPLLILIPKILSIFDEKSKIIVNIIVISLLILYFMDSIINDNNYDILPYKFYWE